MKRRWYIRLLAVGAVITASILTALGLPAAAFAQSPTLSVSPSSGPPGQKVTLTGQGFTAYPGDPVEIDISIDYGNGNWDLLTAGAAYPVPDANGNFSVSVTIPSNAPPGDLLAISSISEPEADAFFTVTGSGGGTAAPAAPSNLAVTAVDPNDIKLTWQDNSSDETGFEINNGVVSRDAGANSTSYTWGGLAPGTYMCFKIRAYNSAGSSAWDPNVSPWYVCTTTPKSQPSPPPPRPAPPSVKTLPYYNYAGYAAYPSTGYVMKIQAIWSVPSISCRFGGVPRAAAWVGMWGDTTSINNNTAWLPQIGTTSWCDGSGNAHYNAFWEMASLVAGQGNSPQFLSSVPVKPNDTIVASVAFLGPNTFPNGYERRKFEFRIHDTTDNKSRVFDELSGGVQLGSIIHQAGAVVEDEPPTSCSFQDIPDCDTSSLLHWLGHGLAQFSPPVHFSHVVVNGQRGATWKYYQYVMRAGIRGPVLAQDSPLGLSGGMYYTITWKKQE